jgi:hypothetical protein
MTRRPLRVGFVPLKTAAQRRPTALFSDRPPSDPLPTLPASRERAETLKELP